MESKFDLFPCGHHGHRVTSYECQRYYDVGACPADCRRHAALVSVNWDIFAPGIAWIFRERGPMRVIDVVPVFEREPVKVLYERAPVKVVVYDEERDGLTPIGRLGIYFYDRFGQVVRRCSDCGKIKSKGGFSPSSRYRFKITSICKGCHGDRRKRRKRECEREGERSVNHPAVGIRKKIQ